MEPHVLVPCDRRQQAEKFVAGMIGVSDDPVGFP